MRENRCPFTRDGECRRESCILYRRTTGGCEYFEFEKDWGGRRDDKHV